MGKFINLKGKKFNRLLVLRMSLRKGCSGQIYWKCRCNCGNISFVDTGHLLNNHSKSCGCLQKEKTKEIHYKHGFSFRKGITKFYQCWQRIKQRCDNYKTNNYKYYGDRGITYDSKWKEFLEFKNDMYFKYIYAKRIYGEKYLSIERMNVNGNYCFDNCIFIPLKDQNKNKRSHGCKSTL
jgi:hypothetical protein